MAGLNVGSFDEIYNDPGIRRGPGYNSAPGLDVGAAPDPAFGGGQVETMEDLMGQGAAVNQRAKMMQQLNRKVQQLRKMGMAPEQIDLLLRGQMGALKPDEEPAYMDVMRQLAMTQRVQAVPGLQKQLRSWPGQPGQPNNAEMKRQEMLRAFEGMGFGGGGQETMEDLLR
jgi:hypothetical protein